MVNMNNQLLPKDHLLKKMIPFLVLETVLTLVLVAILVTKKDDIQTWIPLIAILAVAPVILFIKHFRKISCPQCKRDMHFQIKHSQNGYYCQLCETVWVVSNNRRSQSS